MSDHKVAATSFLNALERIPKQIEQLQAENAKLEKDLPTLREIVGGTWKKEDELKQLKSEVAALERKIQLTLLPLSNEKMEQKQGATTPTNKNEFPAMIIPPKLPTTETNKGFKI